jgi:hypothetical protein
MEELVLYFGFRTVTEMIQSAIYYHNEKMRHPKLISYNEDKLIRS